MEDDTAELIKHLEEYGSKYALNYDTTIALRMLLENLKDEE